MFRINFAELSPEQILTTATEQLQSDVPLWQKNIWHFLQQWHSESETVSVSTSGSTGTPKEISHRKVHIRHSAKLTCTVLRLKKNDTALLCLPADKISGIMMLVRSAEQKMNLVCTEPSTTPLNHLPIDLPLDFAAFTPMQFSSVLTNDSAYKRAQTISKIILGGESVSSALLQKTKLMVNSVYLTFGMTETVSHIALKKISGEIPDKYYRTLPGITVTTNSKQQLIVNAPTLGQNALVTKDEVRIISPTEFEWFGRTDNVINSGGIKIHAEIVEEKLKDKTPTLFFITSQPDKKTGEHVALVLEQQKISAEEIKVLKNVFSFLPKIEQPKTILLVEKFERTTNGKTDRKKTLQKVIHRIEEE